MAPRKEKAEKATADQGTLPNSLQRTPYLNADSAVFHLQLPR